MIDLGLFCLKEQKFTLLLCLLFFRFSNDKKIPEEATPIKIQWVDNLKGDYSFRTKWNYPEGVYRNEWGQPVCDGLCPEGIETMRDTTGKIYADSIAKYYQLVDTSHRFHTIMSEAWCYEWAGTDFITAKKTNSNRIICSTETNAGTHCRLILDITGANCIPRIELNSIVYGSTLKTYYCKNGFIKIDRGSWIKDILKAEFNFNFYNRDEPEKEMFWKGKIYTGIKN